MTELIAEIKITDIKQFNDLVVVLGEHLDELPQPVIAALEALVSIVAEDKPDVQA